MTPTKPWNDYYTYYTDHKKALIQPTINHSNHLDHLGVSVLTLNMAEYPPPSHDKATINH